LKQFNVITVIGVVCLTGSHETWLKVILRRLWSWISLKLDVQVSFSFSVQQM